MKVFLLLFLLASIAAKAQDLRSFRVKTYFIEQAENVLRDMSEGEQFKRSMSTALATSTVVVVEKELVDNTGSLVDAIGIPGKVTLSQERWLDFIKEGRDTRLLVAHELMRMAGIPDDNYVHSRKVVKQTSPQSKSRPYCDLRVAQTTTRESRKEIRGTGYAPAPYGGNVFMSGPNVDNSAQGNAMEAAVQDIKEKCQDQGYERYGTGQGTLSLERRNTNGRKRIEYKVTLNGICSKDQAVRRPREAQREEGCKKVSFCRELLLQEVVLPLDSVDAAVLEDVSRKWKCQ